MKQSDILRRQIAVIGNDIQETKEKIKELTDKLLNPDETRTQMLSDKIEKLHKRQAELQELYTEKDMERIRAEKEEQ